MNKKKKNNFIYWWKLYFTKWSNKAKKKFKLEDYEIKAELKKMAQEQLDLIEDARKDRKTNQQQQEYLDWLKLVAETGKLDHEEV